MSRADWKRNLRCLACGAAYAAPARNASQYCSDDCRLKAQHKRGERVKAGQHEAKVTAGQVEAILSAAVAAETAPPWERHPQPWTDVVVRR